MTSLILPVHKRICMSHFVVFFSRLTLVKKLVAGPMFQDRSQLMVLSFRILLVFIFIILKLASGFKFFIHHHSTLVPASLVNYDLYGCIYSK